MPSIALDREGCRIPVVLPVNLHSVRGLVGRRLPKLQKILTVIGQGMIVEWSQPPEQVLPVVALRQDLSTRKPSPLGHFFSRGLLIPVPGITIYGWRRIAILFSLWFVEPAGMGRRGEEV